MAYDLTLPQIRRGLSIDIITAAATGTSVFGNHQSEDSDSDISFWKPPIGEAPVKTPKYESHSLFCGALSMSTVFGIDQ